MSLGGTSGLCQPMVIRVNLTPTGITNLGYDKRGNFIYCRQLNCDIAQLWNSSDILQLNYEAAWLLGGRWVRCLSN